MTNLRQALRSGLTTRHFGGDSPRVVSTCPRAVEFLLQRFGLPDRALYRVNGPVNLVRLNRLIDQADAPALRFPPYEPVWPQAGCHAGLDLHACDGDVLLHRPFESFEPVVQLLREITTRRCSRSSRPSAAPRAVAADGPADPGRAPRQK